MRNRGVELFIPDDSNVIGSELDLEAAVHDQGVTSSKVREMLLNAHENLIEADGSNFHFRHLTSAAFWTQGYLTYQQHLDSKSAVQNAVELVYKKKFVRFIH